VSDSDSSQIPTDGPSHLYGADGQPQFFQDPAMDRFVAVLLKLAQEVWVINERVANLETALHDQSSAAPDEKSALDKRDTQLAAFINRVLGPLREP
jgi:hypothetical protein